MVLVAGVNYTLRRTPSIRYLHELCHRTRVAHVFHDLWHCKFHPVLLWVSTLTYLRLLTYLRDVVGPVIEDHDVDLPFREDTPQQLPAEVSSCFLHLLATLLQRHSCLEVLLFLVTEPAPGPFGGISKQERDSDTKNNSDDAFHQENPPPTRHAGKPIHLRECVGK
jgi:hypothetical protein